MKPGEQGERGTGGALAKRHFPHGDGGKRRGRARALADVTDTQVQAIRDRLNRRPRLVLKGQNPSETFNGANTT
ncbi:hypothetical protein BKH05_05340 [Actinomyces naeslundii]|nr:hypothetical protein BKH07_02880 [Actinomyces naeslundii]OMG22520.1 hypothetical protein BKH05_05340 [Actinomyces naeslundii]